MTAIQIDLKKEQEATLARRRRAYSPTARLFFWAMDLLTGKTTTLSKVKLLEILASIPYRAWEIRQYARMTTGFRNGDTVRDARHIAVWSREAQDNEYWHLLVIDAKMKEDGAGEAWYLARPMVWMSVTFYVVLTRLIARLRIKLAFHFNAEFEDHAEHVYAEFVKEHPEWEAQPFPEELRAAYGDCATWADAFRRIGLDERDHMNSSLAYCGRPEQIVNYDGMPRPPLAATGAL